MGKHEHDFEKADDEEGDDHQKHYHQDVRGIGDEPVK
jgi:hypothetical protein